MDCVTVPMQENFLSGLNSRNSENIIRSVLTDTDELIELAKESFATLIPLKQGSGQSHILDVIARPISNPNSTNAIVDPNQHILIGFAELRI